uniref:Uncharacterized protein n=1 Tax=Tanacetum cinerariifolium TaxID=118510 RepID=A0A699IXP6_TANCI|nr:hypothetical protein [Tanacetum cinerariifolium]
MRRLLKMVKKCFEDNHLLTLFSAPSYCNEFGALLTYFHIIKRFTKERKVLLQIYVNLVELQNYLGDYTVSVPNTNQVVK